MNEPKQCAQKWPKTPSFHFPMNEPLAQLHVRKWQTNQLLLPTTLAQLVDKTAHSFLLSCNCMHVLVSQSLAPMHASSTLLLNLNCFLLKLFILAYIPTNTKSKQIHDYHGASSQPRWLSGLRRSRVHSL